MYCRIKIDTHILLQTTEKYILTASNNRSIIQVTNITERRISTIKPNDITQKGDANMNDTQRRLVELIQNMTEEQAAFVLTYLADAAEAQEQLPSS